MNKTKIIYLLIAILFLINVGVVTYLLIKESKKTAYVEVGVLYEKFAMTDDLDNEFFAIESKKKNELDSINVELKKLENQFNVETDKSKKQIIQNDYNVLFATAQELASVYSDSNNSLKEQMNIQIYGRINEYVNEFGKQNNYEMIFGANGTGNVMYGSSTKNITEEVIIFINKKYEEDK
jgi:outer membrane protein